MKTFKPFYSHQNILQQQGIPKYRSPATENVVLRLGGETFIGKDNTFIKEKLVTNNNTAITFSTAVSL